MTVTAPTNCHCPDVGCTGYIIAVAGLSFIILVLCVVYCCRMRRNKYTNKYEKVNTNGNETEISQLKIQLSITEREKQDALDRLSSIMSNQLRDGNSDITDLSDQNRPTKLGERFSELYDNKWTNAFEAIEEAFKRTVTKVSEQEGVEFLLEILRISYDKCRTFADLQLQMVEDWMVVPVNQMQENQNLKRSKKNKVKDSLPLDLMKRLKDTRKLYSAETGKTVFKTVTDELQQHYKGTIFSNILTKPALISYIRDCSQLCWFLAVQDPPMEMSFSPETSLNHLKPYTQRGSAVCYLVWPPLYVAKGKALVSKGIAQFY